jgi:hypothetical protein
MTMTATFLPKEPGPGMFRAVAPLSMRTDWPLCDGIAPGDSVRLAQVIVCHPHDRLHRRRGIDIEVRISTQDG